ncbi:ATP-binding protein [Bacteroidota bacterium]
MKELVIISGKGGTGKTSIAASFACLAGDEVVVADCDVDAADMFLLLQADFAKSQDFFSGLTASIDQEKCSQCGICAEVCRFDAIQVINNNFYVDSFNCEGCSYCTRVCNDEAINMNKQNVGEWYISKIKTGSFMVHAKLGIGEESSGKLVAKVKNEAKHLADEINKEIIIVDGSPGIGCPVISSLSGADFVLLVTEPTISGLHDLKRVYKLIEKFKIKTGCLINKSDLNSYVRNEIIEFLEKEDIIHIASIPYNEKFTEALSSGKTIVEYENGDIGSIVTESWNKIKMILTNK